ncbi:MAG: hypothetical protein HYX48_03635 [Chlamydiales bacterium]|nr:hypothetical protein [Chlamydiales bacterium]
MACITAFMRSAFGELDRWGPLIHDSLTTAQNATLLAHVGLSPRQAEWRTWDVENLDTVEGFRTALEEARGLMYWETFKSWSLTISGVLLTPVIVAAMAVAFFAVLALPLVVLDFVAPAILGSGPINPDLENVFLDLATVLGIMGSYAIYWEIPVLLRTAYYCPRVWTKELIPAVNNLDAYVVHLRRAVDVLEDELQVAEAKEQSLLIIKR